MSHKNKKTKKRSRSGQASSRPKPKPRRTALIVAAGFVIIASAIAVPLLLMRPGKDISAYSGAETDGFEQLVFDVEQLGEYRSLETERYEDGGYSRRILCRNAVDVRVWRGPERPEYPLRNQIAEKYPDISDYEPVPPDGRSSLIDGECTFRAADGDGNVRCHRAAIFRRGGWDYLVDLSVGENELDEYGDYMALTLNSIFFI